MHEFDVIKNKLDQLDTGTEKAILLINYNNLGDLICDTPSLRNLRKNYPDYKIIFLLRNESCIQLMKNCPYIDEVLEMPHSRDDLNLYYSFCKKLKKYDYLFSIQFVRPFNEVKRTYIPYMLGINKRLGLIQKDYKDKYKRAFTDYVELSNNTTRTEESLQLLELLNIKIDSDKTECWINPNNIIHFKHSNYIIVQTCATMESRMWHKNNFISLIKLILNNYKDIDILLTGASNENDYINSIKKEIDNSRVFVYTYINLDTLLNYIKNAKLIITNDTGPFHFARAFDVKRIVLFGISPKSYLVRGKEKNSIEFSGNNNCPEKCNIKNISNSDCKKIYKMFGDNYNCINTIKPETVFKSVKLMLEEINEK